MKGTRVVETTWKRFAPPPVCTGTGTIPVDFKPMATEIPSEGHCGICGQRVPIQAGQEGVLATHPYLVKE